MKKILFALIVLTNVLFSCRPTGSMSAIQPKQGAIELPAKGELRIWKDITHPSFSVTLTNNSATQSCEVYKVTSDGSEKWINPSLMAGKSLSISVSTNGHLFFKNFNENELEIEYKVAE